MTEKTTCGDIERQLVERFGVVLAYEDIAEVMRYPTLDALRQAVSKGRVGFRLFPLKGRRGQFAFASDVAAWLWEQSKLDPAQEN